MFKDAEWSSQTGLRIQNQFRHPAIFHGLILMSGGQNVANHPIILASAAGAQKTELAKGLNVN